MSNADSGRAPLGSAVVRYAIAGIFNTALGLGVTLSVQFGAGVAPHLANIAGYAAGLSLSFVLSRRFVFRARGCLIRYGVAVALSFGLNQAVLAIAGRTLGSDPAAAVAAQVIAAASYTALMFVLSRAWVFITPRNPQPRPESAL